MPASHSITDNSIVNQWLPWAVSATLVVAMVWWTFVYVVPVFTDEEVVETRSPTAPAKAVASRSADVGNLNLFGVADKISSPSRNTEAKPTRLKLTLRGILATDDPRTGFAQIQQQKEEKYFAVGDEVFDQATLEEIYIDRVILLNDGSYETLMLPEEFLNNKHFEAAKLKQMRKKVATDYRNIFLRGSGADKLKLFGFDTAWNDGGFVGFIVKALGEEGLRMMEVLGVEDRDLITVINGLRFSETLDAAEELKTLSTATSVDVIIERDGQEIPFHFEFDKPIATPEEIQQIEIEKKYFKNTINEDGTVDRSGFTESLKQTIEDEDLGENWGESDEDLEYIAKQKARKSGIKQAVEFDH